MEDESKIPEWIIVLQELIKDSKKKDSDPDSHSP